MLAAGATLGLNPEQTIAVANSNREAVKAGIRNRRAERVKREGNRALAEEFLAGEDAKFRAKGGLTPFEKEQRRRQSSS